MRTTLPFSAGETIGDRLAAGGQFDLLIRALEISGLDAVLADPATDATLLAPTDAAFVKLAQSLGFSGTDEDAAFDAIVAALTTLAPDGNPVPLLTDVLLYHVLPGAPSRREIAGTAEQPTLLEGATLAPFGRSLGDADPDARDARFTGFNEVASNGRVLAIDEVLLPIDLPGNGDNVPAPPTIAGLVAASGPGFDANGADFDILLAAVSAAGLVEALSDLSADLTVFAPTDAAFLELAKLFGFSGSGEQAAFDAIVAGLTGLAEDGNPIPLLTDILLYHVADDSLTKSQLRQAGDVETLAGGTLSFGRASIIDADPDVRDARFVPGATDIEAANGVVQAIDRVLLPIDLDLPAGADGVGGTIAQQLASSGTGFDGNAADFDILNAALAAAGLTSALDAAGADLTLFAPTDAAFVKLAASFGYTGKAEQGAFDAIVATLTTLGNGDPIPLLTQVLTYHVADTGLTSREIRAADSIVTLNGAELNPFGRSLGDLDPTAADARLLGDRADFEASNGFIQAIDRVLLPLDAPEAIASAPVRSTLADLVGASGDGLDSFGGDFDILEAALATAGLTAALDDPTATLTLLAPTDDAFLKLANGLGFTGSDEAGALDAIVAALTTLGNGDPVPVLQDVLKFHVIGDVFSRQQLDAAGQSETLLGETLLFQGRNITDADPQTEVLFELGGSNVLAENGAFHAIDTVLLPLDLPLV